MNTVLRAALGRGDVEEALRDLENHQADTGIVEDASELSTSQASVGDALRSLARGGSTQSAHLARQQLAGGRIPTTNEEHRQ